MVQKKNDRLSTPLSLCLKFYCRVALSFNSNGFKKLPATESLLVLYDRLLPGHTEWVIESEIIG